MAPAQCFDCGEPFDAPAGSYAGKTGEGICDPCYAKRCAVGIASTKVPLSKRVAERRRQRKAANR